MLYRVLADGIMLLHFAYIVFVIGGALLVLQRRWWMWLHLPAALWGVWVEFFAKTCPLTPLEKHLLRLAGQPAYEGPFLDHYVTPWILRHAQEFGLALAVTNGVVYGVLIWQRASKQAHR